MGDNGFHTWFRDFAIDTLYAVWGDPNAPAQAVAGHTSQPATEPAVTDASESQIGAGSKTAAVLENGNAIASAGNSTLELPASERGDCDCCGKRPYKYTGVFYGIETAYCWECAGETAEEQDE